MRETGLVTVKREMILKRTARETGHFTEVWESVNYKKPL